MSRKPTTLLICAALAGLAALPAAAAAAPTAFASASGGGLVGTLAAGACGAEKAEIGRRAFKKRYGAKKGLKACVKRNRPKARQAISEASAECAWELEEYGPEEFYAEWGSFSACVADYAAWIMDGGGFEHDGAEGEETAEGEEE